MKQWFDNTSGVPAYASENGTAASLTVFPLAVRPHRNMPKGLESFTDGAVAINGGLNADGTESATWWLTPEDARELAMRIIMATAVTDDDVARERRWLEDTRNVIHKIAMP